MRRKDKLGTDADSWRILNDAGVVHLATTTAEGVPVLRPLHAVLYNGAIYFHGAPKGEKNLALGREAIVMAHEVVADVPSTFSDPERACPATTFFVSASAHGILESVDDLDEKATVLQQLMERYQPSGGYCRISAQSPMYRAAVKRIGIVALRPTRLVSKIALGQMKSANARTHLIEQLWQRGDWNDAQAITRMLTAAPLDPLPAFLVGPAGVSWIVAPGAQHVGGSIALLREQYWCADQTAARMAAAHLGAQAWIVGMRDGEVVATARALSDGHKTAYIADVVVRDDLRGHGVGKALMGTLQAHPRIRRATPLLVTRDGGPLYDSLGYGVLGGHEIRIGPAVLSQ